MDAARAQQLANLVLPGGAGLAHESAADIGLSTRQIKAIDARPDDGVLTKDELIQALIDDRLEIDEASGKVVKVSPAFSFVDRPAGPGPAPNPFKGSSALGTRDPQTQPLTGVSPGSYSPPKGMSLGDLKGKVSDPESVTKLLQPFGSAIYDYDRANNGTGPSGAQSPEMTLERRAGICRDSHYLGAYLLQENGYNARQTGYKAEGVMHAVLTYEGKQNEGFGLIEYGTHYSPEAIAKILGRPALSHEEALQAVRPDAKLINLYNKPEASKQGYIESLYYTMGNLLYQDTLKLRHENSAEWDRAGGAKLEMALGEHFGIKLQADTGGSPDPTARNAVSAAVGYQLGNEDNWLRLSAGGQYRPEEGHSSIGPNLWEKHPALVLGVHAEGMLTPLKLRLNENHQLRTTVGGDFTGALAFTRGEGTDASNGKIDGDWKRNDGLSTGLSRANLRLGQHLEGKLSDKLGYHGEVFAAPDLMAMSLGYGTGGKGIYSNTGVNASLYLKQGNFGAHLGAQYLFTQVNNLDATGMSSGVSYSKGPVSLRLDGGLYDSPEGWRARTSQTLNVKITKGIEGYGYAAQERVYNEKYGNFKIEQGTNFGLGVRARF